MTERESLPAGSARPRPVSRGRMTRERGSSRYPYGIEATCDLRKCCPSTRVLMLTVYGNKEFIQVVLEAGASGFLLKNMGKEELHKTLRAVAGGGLYIATEVQRMLDGGDRFKDRQGILPSCPSPRGRRRWCC